MSYSTVAVPWTYPHQPAQALGDSGYDDIDLMIYGLIGSILGGGYIGYKKYGSLGLVGGAVVHPIISTAAGMFLGPIVWWSLVFSYAFIGVASPKKA